MSMHTGCLVGLALYDFHRDEWMEDKNPKIFETIKNQIVTERLFREMMSFNACFDGVETLYLVLNKSIYTYQIRQRLISPCLFDICGPCGDCIEYYKGNVYLMCRDENFSVLYEYNVRNQRLSMKTMPNDHTLPDCNLSSYVDKFIHVDDGHFGIIHPSVATMRIIDIASKTCTSMRIIKDKDVEQVEGINWANNPCDGIVYGYGGWRKRYCHLFHQDYYEGVKNIFLLNLQSGRLSKSNLTLPTSVHSLVLLKDTRQVDEVLVTGWLRLHPHSLLLFVPVIRKYYATPTLHCIQEMGGHHYRVFLCDL